jgi:hypothetical protein
VENSKLIWGNCGKPCGKLTACGYSVDIHGHSVENLWKDQSDQLATESHLGTLTRADTPGRGGSLSTACPGWTINRGVLVAGPERGLRRLQRLSGRLRAYGIPIDVTACVWSCMTKKFHPIGKLARKGVDRSEMIMHARARGSLYLSRVTGSPYLA